MSMTLMVKAMDAEVGNPIRKLVLIKLADQANDKGECWPSYQTIAHGAECSRRAAMSHIKILEQQGFLQIEQRKIGQSQSLTNVYRLTLEKGSANSALGSESAAPPSERAALGSESAALGGSESGAPKPVNNNQSMNQSMNHSNATADTVADMPSENQKQKTGTAKKKNRHAEDLALLAEFGVTGQLAEDHLEIRKAKRQPLTRTALSLLKAEAEKCSLSVEDALTYAVGNGWASFRAEYLNSRMYGGNAGNSATNKINKLPQHTNGGAFLAKDVFQ